MRISVVIPVYNADPYLADSIASVLHQTRPPDEVTVVVQHPTALTLQIIESFGDKILTSFCAERGSARALNVGVRLCSGDLLAFQDADDLWLPEKLERQVEAMTSDPSLEAIFTHVRQFVSPDVPAERVADLMPPKEILAGISKITMLIRRPTFDRVGPFNEAQLVVEFLDWYARAQAGGLKSHMLPEVLALRRLHLANIGRTDTSRRNMENLATIRSLLNAKRKRGGSDRMPEPS